MIYDATPRILVASIVYYGGGIMADRLSIGNRRSGNSSRMKGPSGSSSAIFDLPKSLLTFNTNYDLNFLLNPSTIYILLWEMYVFVLFL